MQFHYETQSACQVLRTTYHRILSIFAVEDKALKCNLWLFSTKKRKSSQLNLYGSILTGSSGEFLNPGLLRLDIECPGLPGLSLNISSRNSMGGGTEGMANVCLKTPRNWLRRQQYQMKTYNAWWPKESKHKESSLRISKFVFDVTTWGKWTSKNEVFSIVGDFRFRPNTYDSFLASCWAFRKT